MTGNYNYIRNVQLLFFILVAFLKTSEYHDANVVNQDITEINNFSEKKNHPQFVKRGQLTVY